MADRQPHLLIIEARFYEDIADELARGALAALERAGATYARVAVPGALELPAALAMAIEADADPAYDGYVILGCVIRGETSHYDVVVRESSRGVMELAVDEALALGFGVLTVDNMVQAWARANVDGGDKGGAAAAAALAMVAIRAHFGL